MEQFWILLGLAHLTKWLHEHTDISRIWQENQEDLSSTDLSYSMFDSQNIFFSCMNQGANISAYTFLKDAGELQRTDAYRNLFKAKNVLQCIVAFPRYLQNNIHITVKSNPNGSATSTSCQ